MFSIIIPTYNNIDYLKLCLRSINNNSKHKHEIIIHVNDGSDGTLDFIKNNKYKYTFSKNNIGLCSSVNTAALNATTQFILYSHDDMYFCPGWDEALHYEIANLKTNAYYLSSTMIEKKSGHIQIDCGDNPNNFKEKFLLENFNKIQHHDYQGSHWAPHLIHKSFWEKIGGFSEEFNPGDGSDPDLNMKLWKNGVRIFKGLSSFRVYHFGSVVLRKKIKRNNGTKTFLLKWGITPTFFVKYYLRGGIFNKGKILNNIFDGPLDEPKKNFSYITNLIICKLRFFYLKIFRF